MQPTEQQYILTALHALYSDQAGVQAVGQLVGGGVLLTEDKVKLNG